MQKYQIGELAYIIESTIHVTQVKILKYVGGYYTVRFSNGGGIRVRENRLYKTKEEAEQIVTSVKARNMIQY
ncbi:MAG TPA: hypothetical protein IAD15_10040 [Candidatus Fimiplasma intestinipullorum]|uniref:Uncharacterized protein n=1 Tax=Candidatus Fimiplasma intestinipullorum TaxID=2840825 RepID=A0A9D1HPY2_9FIRM|nr:hypothetical protein [Candidatus Fimiplasma intestinipullorum]